jgi:hypothetical protein
LKTDKFTTKVAKTKDLNIEDKKIKDLIVTFFVLYYLYKDLSGG